ncbi:PhzF family phenazine biosynthesis protein [Senegalia massiliensis]|uniref:PhzF family phenazine biosynthesis protein n=1 Tax=Senegalia massiliensis TaxID=1720316 RepID=UPI00102FEFFC|nr:PhzF family phenazine biosynthesis protein [Senegalia massiliensis]
MELIMYLVDAFSDKKFSGNPAGVIPDGKELSDEKMQKIARELNLSETAFIQKIDEENYKVRFFTPLQEVDLCGHATIATFYTLIEKGYINALDNGKRRYYQHTRAGKLYIDVYCKDGKIDKVIMEQKKPEILEKNIDKDELSSAMNINKFDIGIGSKKYDPKVISTGLPDIIVPVKTKKILDNLNIDKEKVKLLSEKLNVTGIHAFTIENNDIYSRNFAPLVGIDEEAATGTANGALFYYLRKNKLTDKTEIIVNQGESLNRPSKIICKLGNSIDVIEVGGVASIVLEGIIHP